MQNTIRARALAFILSALFLGAASPSSAQVSLTVLDTPYAQNFDTLPSTGSATWTNNSTIPGWYHARTGNGTTVVAGDGSSNAGNLYSFGTGTSTDRALGSVGSGGAGAGNFFWGVRLQNNSGATITSLDVAYVGEEWRNGGGTGLPQTVAFSYLVGGPTVTGSLAEFQSAGVAVASLNFTSPVFSATAGALNGNLSANRVAISATISGLNIPNGTEVMLRWSDPDHPSNDHGLSVDDFSVTPHGVVATEPAISINDVTQAEGNAGTSNFDFTVSLTSPAGAGGVTFDIATSDGTASSGSDYVAQSLLSQTIAEGASTYHFIVQVNGDMAAEGNETFFVTVSNVVGATAGDAQGLGTIQNDDFGITPIHDIQGPGNTSPLAGQVVTTAGIVTGVKSNGFYIQAAEADYDADPNSSEGIFVFTSSAPPASAAVGNLVTVSGTVNEFIPSADPNSPPTTELGSASILAVTSSGNPLPAPIVLTPADTDPAGPIQQLERFEGMRVQVNSLTTSSPTDGIVNEANATSTSDGSFYGVITGLARPFREPGVEVPDPLPAGSPAGVPRFDANPERLRVETSTLIGSVALNVTSNVVVTNIVGPLDYRFRTYTILTDPASPPVAGPNMLLAPVRAATDDEFTVASFNMERFFDTTDDPGVSDVRLTQTAFDNRLNKASLAIRHVLRTPDVIGVEEMENLTALQAVAQKVTTDAIAAGEPDPMYQAFLVEGNDVGGIDVGLLVKSPRVTVVDVTQFGKDTTYIEPGGATALLNDRPPLVLRAIVNSATHAPYPVTVIVNHLRSLTGIDDPTDGGRVRAKRRAQAEYLANLIQARQTADPSERIVSVGDYNAYQFNDGYVDSIGTIKGTPTPANQVVLASGDLVNPDLADLIDFVPAVQRYSFSFDGNGQELDHVLVTTGPQSQLTATDLQYGRMDADFPEIYRNDPTRPERTSDHDPIVAYFSLGRSLDCTTATAQPADLSATVDHAMRSIAISNVIAANGQPATVTVDAICQDEPTTTENIPAYAIDGDGIGTSTASVRTERNGVRQAPGNGRVYHIFFTATDAQTGGRCSGEVKVGVRFLATVPAADDGAVFDSTKSTGAACAANVTKIQ